MALVGAALLYRSRLRRLGRLRRSRVPVAAPGVLRDTPPLAVQRFALAVLLACCLTIPSNWTQDVPARDGALLAVSGEQVLHRVVSLQSHDRIVAAAVALLVVLALAPAAVARSCATGFGGRNRRQPRPLRGLLPSTPLLRNDSGGARSGAAT